MKQVIYIPPQLRENMISVEDLVPYELNPRKHGKNGVKAIAESIKQSGFVQPILIDQDNRIVSGHGRRLAALELKMEKVPVIKAFYENDDEYLKALLSDNKAAEYSKWDKGLMKEVAEILESLEGESFAVAGFSDEDIDKMFGHTYKETLETSADFGDAGEVDALDDETRVTSMTFKLTVPHHKKCKSVMNAIMRENNFDTIGECLVFMCSKYKAPVENKTVRRKAGE